MPVHFAEAAANELTHAALDPIAKIPEYKVCAVAPDTMRAAGGDARGASRGTRRSRRVALSCPALRGVAEWRPTAADRHDVRGRRRSSMKRSPKASARSTPVTASPQAKRRQRSAKAALRRDTTVLESPAPRRVETRMAPPRYAERQHARPGAGIKRSRASMSARSARSR